MPEHLWKYITCSERNYMNPERHTRLDPLLKKLGIGVSKGTKLRALDELAKMEIFPNLISQPTDLLNNVIKPIVFHFDDTSEAIREHSIITATKLLQQLGNNSLDDTYRTILEMIFVRLEREDKEEVSNNLVDLLKYLSELPTQDTIPSTFDQYCYESLVAISKKLDSKDPKMKLRACDTLDSVVDHCSEEFLHQNISVVMKNLIINLTFRQVEIRKRSIQTLGHALVKSRYVIEDFAELEKTLAMDEKSAIRTALVKFSERMLVEHQNRAELYGKHLLPVLASLSKLIPNHPITPGEAVKPTEATIEAKAAFKALVNIANQYSADLKLQESLEIDFDQERKFPSSTLQLIHEYFETYMKIILPLVADWQNRTRQLGYAALKSLVHVSNAYSARYAPQIIQALVSALKNFPDESEEIMRCMSLFSSFTDLGDINAILLDQIAKNVTKELMEALSIGIINTPNFTEENLGQILDSLITNKCYDVVDVISQVGQVVVSLCTKDKQFTEKNTIALVQIILRICEHADALQQFENCFDHPLKEIFSQNLTALLDTPAKSYRFVCLLLSTASSESVAEISPFVCTSLVQCLTSPQAKTNIYKLLANLASSHSLPVVTNALVEAVLSDMDWRSEKAYIAVRENATASFGALLRENCVSQEVFDSIADKAISNTLASLHDPISDIVRSAAVATIREVVRMTQDLAPRFTRLFDALSDRLKDPLVPVRVGSADILGTVVCRCTGVDDVPGRLEEVIIFMDDGCLEMRESIARFCMMVSENPAWKDSVIKALEKSDSYYHDEAKQLGKEVLHQIQSK